MKITFTVRYRAQWGQRLMVSGSLPQLGSGKDSKPAQMDADESNPENWSLTIDVKRKTKFTLKYKYILFDEKSGNNTDEWGSEREFEVKPTEGEDLFIVDSWRPKGKESNVFFSSAFSRALFKSNGAVKTEKTKISDEKAYYNLNLSIDLPRIDAGDVLALTGNNSLLGNWKEDKAVAMTKVSEFGWNINLPLKKSEIPFEYKFCIVEKKTGKVKVLEDGENRVLELETLPPKDSRIIVSADDFRFGENLWKGAGVAIPVFSLRSKNGYGVGEFLDLKLTVDWAVKTGLKMIQILPVNDTVATHTWVDSYPYAAISVFALHPIYLNLQKIGSLSSKITKEVIDEQAHWLNDKPEIDYEGVMRVKSRFFKLIYDEQKDNFLKSKDFKAFFENNKEWLVPYAAFSYLRDLYGTPDFTKWGRFSKPTEDVLEEICNENSEQYDDIAVHYFIQYHLHVQLLEAAEYAREKGVVLKGDIPIGIYRNSVDAWMYTHLYNMESQAGAPPDDFSDLGQNWKFPTYNWDEMAKDNYHWWKSRLKQMSTYFDSFRIDHILGFFRIWEIPADAVTGTMGYFNPSIPIHVNEFKERDVYFDYERFCSPYIKDHFLYHFFGDITEYAKSKFLYEIYPETYSFKPEFDTQKKVEEYLKLPDDASMDQRMFNERLKNGLFSLHNEVLFFEAPFSNKQAFNPRHSIFKTNSFRELDPHTREHIHQLYLDYFYSRNEEFWRKKAMVKLPAIKEATDMLICGEDLGMVPDCVPQVMRELEILSLEVQRMPKNQDIEFGHPNNYPYLSVATPSSHDTSTTRGWWEEDKGRTQRFYNQILGKHGGAPYFCEPWVVKDIIMQHLYSPSMWAVFPIQDIIGINGDLRFENPHKERINNPGNPQHYWRYRMHINLEDLLEKSDFNNEVLDMIKETRRFNNY